MESVVQTLVESLVLEVIVACLRTSQYHSEYDEEFEVIQKPSYLLCLFLPVRFDLPFFKLITRDLIHLLHRLVKCIADTIFPIIFHRRVKGTDALLASSDMQIHKLFELFLVQPIPIIACFDELRVEEAIWVLSAMKISLDALLRQKIWVGNSFGFKFFNVSKLDLSAR